MKKRIKERPPKKTRTLEIRVSEEEKSAFLDVCSRVNRSASEVLRQLMGLYVTVQSLRVRLLRLVRLNSLKSAGAGIAASAAAIALTFSVFLAPVATANSHLQYRIVVDDGVGEVISEGRMDFGAKTASTPIIEPLGETVQYELRATPCSRNQTVSCSSGQILIEVDILDQSKQSESKKMLTSFTVAQGEAAQFVSDLPDGRVLSGDLISGG